MWLENVLWTDCDILDGEIRLTKLPSWVVSWSLHCHYYWTNPTKMQCGVSRHLLNENLWLMVLAIAWKYE